MEEEEEEEGGLGQPSSGARYFWSPLSLSLSLCLCRKPKPVSPLRRMHLTMLQTCFYPVAYMSLVGTHLVPCLIV